MEMLASPRAEFLVVRTATQYGRKEYGVFAKRPVPAGTITGVFDGPMSYCPCDTWKRYFTEEEIRHPIQVDARLIANSRSGATLFNHSCDPNCRVVEVKDGSTPVVFLMTRRRIAAGEELTFHYSSAEAEPFIPHCRCGTQNCPGSDLGFDRLPLPVRQELVRDVGVLSWLLDPHRPKFLGPKLGWTKERERPIGLSMDMSYDRVYGEPCHRVAFSS